MWRDLRWGSFLGGLFLGVPVFGGPVKRLQILGMTHAIRMLVLGTKTFIPRIKVSPRNQRSALRSDPKVPRK